MKAEDADDKVRIVFSVKELDEGMCLPSGLQECESRLRRHLRSQFEINKNLLVRPSIGAGEVLVC